MRNGGQTSIEYLMLIGAAIFFVVVASLAARSAFLPAAKSVPTTAAQIVTAAASLKITPTSIVLPTPAGCTPGSVCFSASMTNNTANCSPTETVQPCQDTCITYCSADGVCPPPCTAGCEAKCIGASTPPSCILHPIPVEGTGPFNGFLVALFTNLPPSVTSATLKCSSSDAGAARAIISGAAYRTCSYPAVATETDFLGNATAGDISCINKTLVRPVPIQPPECVSLVANPDEATGPFDSTLTATFANVPDGTPAQLKCNQTDPGMDVAVTGGIAIRTCRHRITSSQVQHFAEASAMGAICPTETITNLPTPPSCTVIMVPASDNGPFTANIFGNFTNLETGITQALIKCTEADAGTLRFIIGGQYAFRTCSYPAVSSNTPFIVNVTAGTATCTAILWDLKDASCVLTASPALATGPFQSNILATFSDLPEDTVNATIRCNSTDPGIESYLIAHKYATRVCPYPSVSLNTIFTANASTPQASCIAAVSDQSAAGSGSCTLSASPSSATGPFQSLITATFSSLPFGITTATLRCNSTDSGVVVPIDGLGRASRFCTYPFVDSQYSRTAIAAADGISCTTDVTIYSQPPCAVTSCDLTTGQFYSPVIFTGYSSSPPIIPILDPSLLCNNGGGPCLGEPCRVRGSQRGENICALIEDLGDYDWNDFVFSTEVEAFPQGQRLLKITVESIDSAATNWPKLFFQSPAPKIAIDLQTNETKIGTDTNFTVWQNPHLHVGETKSYFYADAGANLPPLWTYSKWPLPVQQGDSSDLYYDPIMDMVWDPDRAPLDLWALVVDEAPDSELRFQITQQANPIVGTFSIISNRYLHYQMSYYGSTFASSYVTIRVTDPSGLWEERQFELVRGGPKLDLPEIIRIPTYQTLTLDLHAFSGHTFLDNDALSYSVEYVGYEFGPPLANCFIYAHVLTCPYNPNFKGMGGNEDVIVRVSDGMGGSSSDIMRVLVN